MESKWWENKEYWENNYKMANICKKQLDNFLENYEDMESDSEDDSIIDINELDENKIDFLNDNFYFNEEYLNIKLDNKKYKISIEFLNINCILSNQEFFEKISNEYDINLKDKLIEENLIKIKEFFYKFFTFENHYNNKLKKWSFDINLDKRLNFEEIIKNDEESNMNSYSTYDSSDNESISSKNSQVVESISDVKVKPTKGKSNKNTLTIKIKDQESIEKYREQEYQRYLEPNKPWCFILEDGKKRFVAPVSKKNHNSLIKARDHFLLKSERPSYVTLLSLVRDAASKLPEGIGTRTDICQLLKESQFINEEVNEEKLSQVVSGALDRLHYEEDPCVKYDNEKKLWIYLHLNRTLESKEWFINNKKKSKKDTQFKIKIPIHNK